MFFFIENMYVYFLFILQTNVLNTEILRNKVSFVSQFLNSSHEKTRDLCENHEVNSTGTHNKATR